MALVYSGVLYGPQWTIGDLTINATDANGVDWILTKETGWFASSPPKPQRSAKTAATGSFRSQNYRGERIISLEGEMIAPTIAALRTAQHQLAGQLGDPSQLYQLACLEETGTLTASVELDGPILITPISYLSCSWSLQLAAPDPHKYAATASVLSTLLASGVGGLNWSPGLDWATGGGLNWGTVGATGVIAAQNPGTANAWPTYTVNAGTGLTNPAITNSATGQVLKWTGTLASGDVLVISTSPFNRFVTVNGADRRPFLTSAQWFPLTAGTTTSVAFAADSYSATASMQASWYAAYF